MAMQTPMAEADPTKCHLLRAQAIMGVDTR